MRLIIVSGLSGSGKSVALHTLEDADYYCMDNIPVSVLPVLVEDLVRRNIPQYDKVAVGVDARSSVNDIKDFPVLLDSLKKLDNNIDIHTVFLEATDPVLIKRFSETRRKHPLSHKGLPLVEAIQKERSLLSTVKENSDLVIDTTRKTIHELIKLINARLVGSEAEETFSLLFQSFGFKHGIPADSDFVFDVRCLPNPYWLPELRPLTGLNEKVGQFLEEQALTKELLQSIQDFLAQWLPKYQSENRRYLTVSIGCTGGQHRSVYFCERLADFFAKKIDNISIRHRELS